MAQELGLEETGRQKFRKEIFVFLKRGSAERGGGLKTNCRGWHSVFLNGNEMLGRLWWMEGGGCGCGKPVEIVEGGKGWSLKIWKKIRRGIINRSLLCVYIDWEGIYTESVQF